MPTITKYDVGGRYDTFTGGFAAGRPTVERLKLAGFNASLVKTLRDERVGPRYGYLYHVESDAPREIIELAYIGGPMWEAFRAPDYLAKWQARPVDTPEAAAAVVLALLPPKLAAYDVQPYARMTLSELERRGELRGDARPGSDWYLDFYRIMNLTYSA